MIYRIILFILILGYGIPKWSAQIASNQVSHIENTNYPVGYKQDLIYFFCDPSQIDLYATSPTGQNVNFEWSKYDPATQTFSVFKNENNRLVSYSDNQTEGGFKVKITNALGKTTHCFKVWVFVPNVTVDAQVSAHNCKNASLEGTYTPTKTFQYYVMPEEPFVVDSSTIIQACFDIEHTQVSDVGFMIYGPASSGYPAVTIYPHPNNQNIPAQNTGCNLGSDMNNLCFSTNLTVPYPVCILPTPITGTYGWYKNGFTASTRYPIGSDNRYLLNGCKATEPGWQIQFFDGSIGNTGKVKKVTLTFTNPNPNNFSPDMVELTSGSINFPFIDNADKWSTAPKYNVPAYVANVPTTPIIIDYINNTRTYVVLNNSMLWSSNHTSDVFSISNTNQTEASNLSSSDTTTFIYTVGDEYGCHFSDEVKYLHKIPQIDSVTIHNTTCYGDQDGILIVNSIWANQFSIDGGINFGPSNLFINLPQGNYEIVVTDGTGCYDTTDAIIDPGVTIIPTIAKTDNLCFGECKGTISIQSSGGQIPYHYQWSHSPFNISVAANLCPNTYHVTIADNNGCDTALAITITQPAPITFTSTITPSNCITADGSVALSPPNGGTGPYHYEWSNGDSDNTLDHVFGGIYTVTVMDVNACKQVSSYVVQQRSKPVVALSPSSDTTICYGSGVSIASQILSGVGPFTYTWNTQQTSSAIDVQPESTTCYSLVVHDQNQCPADTKRICINVLPPIQPLNDVNLLLCEGVTLHLNADATGGNPDSTLKYTWSHGLGNSKQVTFVPPYGWPQVEIYEVVISDGCSKNDTTRYTLNFYEPPVIVINANQRQGCIPLEVEFTSFANIYTSCEWIFGDGYTSEDCAQTKHTYSDSGRFDVRLKLEYGNHCFREQTFSHFIFAEGPPEVDFKIISDQLTVFDSEVLLQSVYEDSIISWEWFVMGNINPSDTLFHETGLELMPLNFEDVFQQKGPYVYYFDDQKPFPVVHKITSKNGCSNEITKFLELNKKTEVFVPNTFTPDGDGINDEFYPIGLGVNPEQDYDFKVLDRWGNTVFESQDAKHVWNGHFNNEGDLVEQGIYTWHFRYADIRDKLRFTSGSVLVMRQK